MALYVAPRAAATVLPVSWEVSVENKGKESGKAVRKLRELESVVFAISLAVLMTASKHGGKDGVRGFIGMTLRRLMEM
jgi:hypothetical protein